MTSHGGAAGGAAFKVKCFKQLHRVPAVDRMSIELLARVDVSLLCCVVIWCAAEIHCNISLTFIIRFIAFINDDIEGLNAINQINLSLPNVVFTNW